jgi:thiamine biosynthesis protein ThiI
MKLVSLLSSGIDSPVATFLMSKKADEIILLHGNIMPYTDRLETENFISIATHLKKIISSDIKTYVLSHGKALKDYKLSCENKFTCVFCKRMLLRYAEEIAKKEKAEAIIMGDSLGQVASQTIQNIKTIDQAVNIPIFRPLIGYDKEDIIKIAKEIETYELSILPSESCNAVPNKPSTRARISKILEIEKKINIEYLVKSIVDEAKLIRI